MAPQRGFGGEKEKRESGMRCIREDSWEHSGPIKVELKWWCNKKDRWILVKKAKPTLFQYWNFILHFLLRQPLYLRGIEEEERCQPLCVCCMGSLKYLFCKNILHLFPAEAHSSDSKYFSEARKWREYPKSCHHTEQFVQESTEYFVLLGFFPFFKLIFMCFTWHLLHSGLYTDFYKLLYFCMRILAWTRIYPASSQLWLTAQHIKLFSPRALKRIFSKWQPFFAAKTLWMAWNMN